MGAEIEPNFSQTVRGRLGGKNERRGPGGRQRRLAAEAQGCSPTGIFAKLTSKIKARPYIVLWPRYLEEHEALPLRHICRCTRLEDKEKTVVEERRYILNSITRVMIEMK